MFNRDAKHAHAERRRCGIAVPVLIAMIAAAPLAVAQESDPEAEESSDLPWADPEDSVEGEEGELPGSEEDAEAEEPEGLLRRRDGAAARRELLFREGIEQRERLYPRGLQPHVPVERSDLQAFDPRYRGRNAMIMPGAQPGLMVDSSIAAGFQFDTNPLLLTPEETGGENTDAWGFIVEPAIAVRRIGPRTALQSVLRLRYDQLNTIDDDNDDDDLSTFNQHFGAQFDVYGQHNAFNLFTNVTNASSRTQLVEETGLGRTDAGTLTYGGGGAFKHALTANSVVQLSGSIRRQDVDTVGLEDSTFYQAGVDYRRLVTPTGAIGVAGIFERFVPDGQENRRVDVATGLLSWSDDIGPRLSVYVEAGGQYVTGEDVFDLADSDSAVDALARALLYWAVTERDTFVFEAGRSVEPNAAGDVRTDNRFEVSYFREMTRDISLGVPVLVLFQTATLDDSFDNRTFFQVRPTLTWAFAPAWNAAVEYRFRLENEDNFSTATSNAGILTVTYFGRLIP